MSATIRIGNETATVNGGQWSSSNPNLAELLPLMDSPLGPSGADPDPDKTAAEAACSALGGEVVRATDRPAVPVVEGLTY
jgi:hypothetical protein